MSRSALLLLLWLPAQGLATEIVERDWSDPHPGVRLLQGRTRAPAADFHALYVDLCGEGVRLAATEAGAQRRTPSAWGRSVGAQAAINGDFFRTDTATPVVYGQAVGGGRVWPARQTGAGAQYEGEWYYRDYGWIAFGPGWTEFDHTKWAKRNVEIHEGFHGAALSPEVPPGTVALVSGFPELVTEGARHRCADPTANTCFPDRSDMRARHPRSAMGLTQDRRTFLLVVVDGRSGRSAGMYGSELAWLMENLGAWQAYNLDGGGSSALWVQGPGVVNNPSDGSQRAVANHWGVLAGGAGEPGSCPVGVTVEGCLGADPTGARCANLVAWLLGASLSGQGTTDIDGDGRADVCGRGVAGLWCHLAGDEGFTDERAFEVGLSDDQGWADPSNGLTLRFGDVNGDGLADVCARGNAGVRCWPASPDGVGARIVGPALSDEDGYDREDRFATLLLADVTGDGRDDVCARAERDVRCWPSTGEGFGPELPGPAWGDGSDLDRPEGYGTLRAGDVDGDGRADLCARLSTGVRCALAGAAGFAEEVAGPEWRDDLGWSAPRHWSTIRLADVDGDRRADLCALTARDVRCHLSTGDGFGPAEVAAPLEGEAWRLHAHYGTVRTGDIDGDGRQDLCARGPDGLVCWLRRGDGAWDAWPTTLFSEALWDEPTRAPTIQLADVDGDGRADACGRAGDGVRCHPAIDGGFSEESLRVPEFTDAGGWAANRYSATVRVAGPRREPPVPDAEPPPTEGDAGPRVPDGGRDEPDAGTGGDARPPAPDRDGGPSTGRWDARPMGSSDARPPSPDGGATPQETPGALAGGCGSTPGARWWGIPLPLAARRRRRSTTRVGAA